METLRDTASTVETALELHRLGLRLVPLQGKAAFIRDWPDLRLGESELRSWSRRGINWGIVTHEPLVVLDTDTEAAEAWVRSKGIDSPVMVRSGGGGLHRYFRLPADVTELRSRSGMHRIAGLDLKAWRSYIVAVGSVHSATGRLYEYLPGRELHELHNLPAFNMEWLPREERREPLQTPENAAPRRQESGPIRDFRAYIRAIPSIQGQNGSNACYRVAALLVEQGLPFDQLFTELEAWNETCAFPRWSRDELLHKIESVLRNKRAHA